MKFDLYNHVTILDLIENINRDPNKIKRKYWSRYYISWPIDKIYWKLCERLPNGKVYSICAVVPIDEFNRTSAAEEIKKAKIKLKQGIKNENL